MTTGLQKDEVRFNNGLLNYGSAPSSRPYLRDALGSPACWRGLAWGFVPTRCRPGTGRSLLKAVGRD